MAEAVARLAAFSGVYGNPLALCATLTALAADRHDAVWCLGDLGGIGPRPDDCVALLREAGLSSLAGNYEDSLGHGREDCACGYLDPRDRRLAQIAYDHTRARLSPGHRAWMRTLPAQVRLILGGRRVLLCHGSPRRANEFLWESTCSDAFLEWLCATHEADVLVCGHTGIPWQRRLPSGRVVVNVGAVGCSANDGRPEAWHASIAIAGDVEVTLRRVPYDHLAVAVEMEVAALPEEFVETIRSGWWAACLGSLPEKERGRGRH